METIANVLNVVFAIFEIVTNAVIIKILLMEGREK